MYVFLHLTGYTSEVLIFHISLLTCTARPTTQPVVSDIRHAKQVTLPMFVHDTLALYSGSPLPPPSQGLR